MRGQAVVHYTDSQNVADMLLIGSKTESLHKRVVQLFLKLKELNIAHEAVWLSREDPRIKVADAGSRDFDIDNWWIDIVNFRELDRNWGPFSVDVFASEENKRMDKFYSRENSVFCQSLVGEHVWACPPPRLILPAVRIFARDRVTGVLCVPMWQASPFWLALYPDGSHVANVVKNFMVFKPFFLAGEDMTNECFQGTATFYMVALNCDFGVEKPFQARRREEFKLLEN